MWQWINIAGLIAALVVTFINPNAGGALLFASAISVGIRLVVQERKRKRSERRDV